MLSAHLQEAWLAEALHDLCQPLTALQCRLFIATMGDGPPDPAEMQSAVQQSLAQCERAIAMVRAMQNRAHQAQEN